MVTKYKTVSNLERVDFFAPRVLLFRFEIGFHEPFFKEIGS